MTYQYASMKLTWVQSGPGTCHRITHLAKEGNKRCRVLGRCPEAAVLSASLLPLDPGRCLDGAQRSVEPRLLGRLHLVQGEAQVVL